MGITRTVVVGVLFSISSLAGESYTIKNYETHFETGLIETPESMEFAAQAPRMSAPKVLLPGRYSLRGVAGPVENQGACGSCWDFALTSVLRGTYQTNTNDPGRLSFNYLLNCAKDMWGCNGGNFSAAKHLVRSGRALKGPPLYGQDGPYVPYEGVCDPKPAKASALTYFFAGGSGSASFRDVAYVLSVLRRPLAVDVAVNDDWKRYGGGVFDGCGNNKTLRINHMVSLEGYDCESSVDSKGNCVFDKKGNLPPGVGKWIIRNSWGTSWGDGGYITTKATNKAGQRCNKIVTTALYFKVK